MKLGTLFSFFLLIIFLSMSLIGLSLYIYLKSYDDVTPAMLAPANMLCGASV